MNNFKEKIRNSLKYLPQNDKGDRIQAYCPVHDDKNASLSIKFDGDRALIFCHAGCDIKDILKKSNLEFADLFADGANPVGIYQYRREDWSLSHEKLKYKTTDGKTFRQRHIDENGNIVDNLDNIKRIPYNYPLIIKAIKQGSLILYVEGEKDADTAKILGYTATTMGSASDWKDEYKSYFKGACLILVPDKDDAGLKLTSKMIDSLKSTCKSLKTLVLPQGKDLTEWVEAGNHDLMALGTSQEMINSPIPIPMMVKTLSGYVFTWTDFNLEIKVERLTSDTECELSILENGILLHIGKLKLLSTININQVVKLLAFKKKIDWNTILNQLVSLSLESLRKGSVVENMDDEPLYSKVEYLINPILPLNQPTTIFAPGGSGKSTLVDYIAVLAQFGICPNSNIPFEVRQANVLYLDWEDNINNHRIKIKAIKKALGIQDKTTIRYQKCEHSLSDIIDDVRKVVSENDIELVIIDSQMAATADSPHGMSDAQIANEYYNNLRSLNCTTLTIDHVTKSVMNGGTETVSPYGSVVKYNRSRCQFELKVEQEPDSNTLIWALIQKKNNLGKIIKPIGIGVTYQYMPDGSYDMIYFDEAKLSDSPTLNKVLPKTTRIINAIKELGGRATIKQISEQMGESDDYKNIGVLLANKNKYFTKVSEGTYVLAL